MVLILENTQILEVDTNIMKKPRKPRKSKSTKQKYCGIGTWIYDSKPPIKIERPDKLPDKLDANALRDYASYYGLGYCIHEYIPSNKIADKKIAKLWEECRKQIVQIIKEIYVK